MPQLMMLLDSWAQEFAQALQMMTGQQFRVSKPVARGGAAGNGLWWTQSCSLAAGGAFSVGADYHVWVELGTRALQGAGIEIVEEAEARSTWLEIVQQSISGAARTAGLKLSRTIEVGEGHESASAPAGGQTFSVTVTTPDGLESEVQLVASEELARLEPPKEEPRPSAEMVATPSSSVGPSASVPASRTMDALLDVHLPVSISFGSSVMPLKDVLKLSAGSVVELNRHPEDPVDIIVNDYVIARGEVVVVDGNYAVRIHEIVSRQQRLGLRDGSLKR